MRIALLIFSVFLALGSRADQLDGLAVFDFLIYVILIGAIALLALIISSFIRFSIMKNKVSIPLNFSASILITCAFIAMGNLSSSIDPGFLVFCLGTIVLSIFLMILNYRVGIKKSND